MRTLPMNTKSRWETTMGICRTLHLLRIEEKDGGIYVQNKSVVLNPHGAGAAGVYRESAGEEYSAECADSSADRIRGIQSRGGGFRLQSRRKPMAQELAALKNQAGRIAWMEVTALSRRRGLARRVF